MRSHILEQLWQCLLLQAIHWMYQSILTQKCIWAQSQHCLPERRAIIVLNLLLVATTWSTYTRKVQRSAVQAIADAGKGLLTSAKSLVQCSTARSGLWAAAAIAQGLYGLKLLLTSAQVKKLVEIVHVVGMSWRMNCLNDWCSCLGVSPCT